MGVLPKVKPNKSVSRGNIKNVRKALKKEALTKLAAVSISEWAAARPHRKEIYKVFALALVNDLERIPVRIEYIRRIVSRIVFQSCPR